MPGCIYLRSGPTPEEGVLLAVSEEEELVVDALLACGFRNCRCKVVVIVKNWPHEHETGFMCRYPKKCFFFFERRRWTKEKADADRNKK